MSQHELRQIDSDRLILVVTGAHLRSESGDRPLAYHVRDLMLRWREEHLDPVSGSDAPAFDVVVCSDIWRMNNEELTHCPTVSIGGPGVNAYAAYLADKLDSVFVVDDYLIVQMDLEFTDCLVSCWGMDHESTVASVEKFIEKYLEDFMDAAALQIAQRSV